MLRENFRLLRRFYFLVDMTWIALSWIAAYGLRFHSGLIPIFYGVPPFETYLMHLPLVLLVWMVAMIYGGVYHIQGWWQFAGKWRVFLKSSLAAIVLLVGVTYLSTKAEFSRIGYLCFWALSFSGLLSYRYLLQRFYPWIFRTSQNIKKILIVGNNGSTGVFCENVQNHPELGLNISGRLLDEALDAGPCRLPVLGGYSQIREVVQKGQVDIVVFTLTLEHTWQLKPLLGEIEDLSVDIQVIPDVFSIMPLQPGIQFFEGIPLIQVRAGPHEGMARVGKRLLDISLTLPAILMLFPFCIVIAILIKATSFGPVFYRQPRLGLNGKEFSILKFRTMGIDAEIDRGPVWSQKQDSRKTPLGAFLRSYSLDEIPQLWNVLKGDMSLVGPRPERPEFIHEFQKKIPIYILRHKVKSGLTGLAQVNGWRGATSLEKRIEYDIKYIEKWSLGLDLKILWRTLWGGFINKAES